ncbi:hypothetical protein [Dyella sp. A6]|uniref:hypothetical protein n=1 Tax=Dyella aluminiiresistens TaxID=3069105 RepID=UPI002E7A2142|nr:hypothetical protein [Dyella sp. A6]
MTTFFWSAGHLGWFFFGAIVFSVVCLLVTDIAWRVMRTSSRRLLAIVGVVWVLGIAALVAGYR